MELLLRRTPGAPGGSSPRRHRRIALALLCATLLAAACAIVRPIVARPGTEVGNASWYGKRHAGRRTASGERFDPADLTAAHPSLPFGTRVRVTNLENGRSVVVRVNDRGPFVRGRIIDLSAAAARSLGVTGAGAFRVSVEVLR